MRQFPPHVTMHVKDTEITAHAITRQWCVIGHCRTVKFTAPRFVVLRGGLPVDVGLTNSVKSKESACVRCEDTKGESTKLSLQNCEIMKYIRVGHTSLCCLPWRLTRERRFDCVCGGEKDTHTKKKQYGKDRCEPSCIIR